MTAIAYHISNNYTRYNKYFFMVAAIQQNIFHYCIDYEKFFSYTAAKEYIDAKI